MKAMIFAAGLGTRLAPLTDTKPKALVEIAGKPMLGRLIEKMIRFGINDLVINIHHFGEQILEYLHQNNNFGIRISVSDERDLLLDTGGGLKKARPFFEEGEAFLVHNVDILSDIDFRELFEQHHQSRPLATLPVIRGTSQRRLKFDTNNNLCAWENLSTGELKIAREPEGNVVSRTFTGIHIINPEIFKQITEKGVFSIIDLYLRLAEKHHIKGFEPKYSFWSDLGKPDDLKKAAELFLQPNSKLNI
jgi:NDP-sugar pyrophosphorylase family protein